MNARIFIRAFILLFFKYTTVGSTSGKYIIPFAIILIILNLVMIVVIALQDILVPDTVIAPMQETPISFPVSSPISFPLSFTR